MGICLASCFLLLVSCKAIESNLSFLVSPSLPKGKGMKNGYMPSWNRILLLVSNKAYNETHATIMMLPQNRIKVYPCGT